MQLSNIVLSVSFVASLVSALPMSQKPSLESRSPASAAERIAGFQASVAKMHVPKFNLRDIKDFSEALEIRGNLNPSPESRSVLDGLHEFAKKLSVPKFDPQSREIEGVSKVLERRQDLGAAFASGLSSFSSFIDKNKDVMAKMSQEEKISFISQNLVSGAALQGRNAHRDLDLFGL